MDLRLFPIVFSLLINRYHLRKITLAATVAAIAIVATAYASPYYALHQIKTAVAERNADALASHVDFPALRDSVKTQLQTAMAGSVQAAGGSDNPFAAMGQAIAGAMMGKMVDAMVSPAGVVALVNKSAVSPQAGADDGASASTGDAREKAGYSAGYTAWDTFAVRSKDGEKHGALLMKRHGLWGWKLSAIAIAPAVAGR